MCRMLMLLEDFQLVPVMGERKKKRECRGIDSEGGYMISKPCPIYTHVW